jgi:pimeloyl-ACP methyl ester carboxylesterase
VSGRAIALAAVATAVTLPAVAIGYVLRRGSRSLLDAPRTRADEAELAPAVDALGGEIVRLRARDGVRLAGRWLPAEHEADGTDAAGDAWRPDPYEAIVLLHGYSGSIAPNLVEYAPFLRRTAGVLALDFRGHGDSDAAPTTFGMHEVEDVAGALAWLGERGIRRAALFGTSMGGMTAIAAVAILGDGMLAGADMDLDAPAGVVPPPRPRIVAVVADSVAPELVIPVASRIGSPFPRFVAGRLFDAAARTLGTDLRDTEPIRMIGLIEPVPLLLIHGEDDATVPIADGRRLASAAGPTAEHWVVPGADHSAAHEVVPDAYETRVTATLRAAFASARDGSL